MSWFITIVCIQGFRAYAQEFFRIHVHDGLRLYPIRATLVFFAICARCAENNGGLDENRYATAIRACLTTQQCYPAQSSYMLPENKHKAPESRYSLNTHEQNAVLTPECARSLFPTRSFLCRNPSLPFDAIASLNL
jgi:hypothetical protein